MAISVDILDTEVVGDTVESTVVVSIDTAETRDYKLRVEYNDVPMVNESGTLFGGSGSFPGDSETYIVEGPIDAGVSGQVDTVKAEVYESGLFGSVLDTATATVDAPSDSPDPSPEPDPQPDPEVSVDILGVEILEGPLRAVPTIVVSTEQAQTIDYTLETEGGGGIRRFQDTLFGGSGSFPGDSNTHEPIFNVEGQSSGTIEAEIISGPSGSATRDFEVSTGGGGGQPPVDQPVISPDDLSINCLSTTLDDTIRAGFSTNPLYNVTNFANADVRATIAAVVDGQQVATDQVDIPEGQTASARIPIRFDTPGTYDVGFEVTNVEVI